MASRVRIFFHSLAQRDRRKPIENSWLFLQARLCSSFIVSVLCYHWAWKMAYNSFQSFWADIQCLQLFHINQVGQFTAYYTNNKKNLVMILSHFMIQYYNVCLLYYYSPTFAVMSPMMKSSFAHLFQNGTLYLSPLTPAVKKVSMSQYLSQTFGAY